jgi:hypothetical protein
MAGTGGGERGASLYAGETPSISDAQPLHVITVFALP